MNSNTNLSQKDKSVNSSISENGKKDTKSQEKFSTRDSDGRELSEAQQEYFKDSKVRDENGNLLVVYHGTPTPGFTVYKRNVTFFTDNKEVANTYTNNDGIYEQYLNITKPVVINANNDKWSMINADKISVDGIDDFVSFLKENGASVWQEKGANRTSTADIVSAIEDAIDEEIIEADGIIIKNVYDDGGHGDYSLSHLGTDYVIFNSNQAKNTNNLNPTDNEDIRYSDRNIIDRYTEKQYNNYGWVAVNEVLTGKELKKLYSQFANIKNNKNYNYKNRNGEHLIPVGDKYDSYDKLVYIKGTNQNPIIRQVISVIDEVNIDEEKSNYIKELLDYETRYHIENSWEVVEAYAGEQIFSRHTIQDYNSYNEIKRGTGNGRRKRVSFETVGSDRAGNNGSGIQEDSGNLDKYSDRDPLKIKMLQKNQKILKKDIENLQKLVDIQNETNQYLKQLVKLQGKNPHGFESGKFFYK